MDQRVRFIEDCGSGLYSTTELCQRYGISRKTGHKWLKRFHAGGVDGLEDRSRAPHRRPHTMAPETAAAIVEARQRHPLWGPIGLPLRASHSRPEFPSPSPPVRGKDRSR